MGKCKQCKGRLEEDFISDYLAMSVDQRPCASCRGTGVIRTGPYRLADGDDRWSDRVVRHWRINSFTWQVTNPLRTFVYQECPHTWVTAPGYHGDWKRFDTHAEAIAYADRMARTNQGEKK